MWHTQLKDRRVTVKARIKRIALTLRTHSTVLMRDLFFNDKYMYFYALGYTTYILKHIDACRS